MRITYFTDTYRIGGAERVLVNLVVGAAGAGHDVTVAGTQASVLDLVAREAPAAALVRVKADLLGPSTRQARIAAFARAFPELAIALRRTRPQLVHVNNGGYPGSELCRAATIVARFARAPSCVLTVNSTPLPRELYQPRLQTIADRLVWRSVDAVHVATAFVAGRLGELRGMPPGLGAQIPYGVAEPSGTNDDGEAMRRRLGHGNALLAGMVSASGEVEKGHVVFVEALARAGPDVHAVIVGAHPEHLPQQVETAGLSDRVAVVGRVPPGDFGAYLRAMDLLVVPSTAYESLPLVVLEAMAAGKPVFASRLSGIPEAVDDGVTGRLFEPGDVDELAALLVHATRARDELASMGKVGHDHWRARFSTGAMTTSMLDLYERLVAQRNRAHAGRANVSKR
jgi:glycosyltransferase involved in cell wall biosynthesis